MKCKLIIALGYAIFSFQVRAQTASVNGKLNLPATLKTTVAVFLYNDRVRDTMFTDKDFTFRFANVPYGVYSLKTAINHGLTSYEDILVTNILIDKESIEIYPIKLFRSKTCGCSSSILGQKDTIEYYKTGEVFGKGHYRISKKYYSQFKSFKYSYKKQGLWNYYYRDGMLLRQTIYDNDNIVSFKDFYESGGIKLIGYYDDCKSKTWEYYSEDGVPVFKVDFSVKFLVKIEYKYLSNYMKSSQLLEDF